MAVDLAWARALVPLKAMTERHLTALLAEATVETVFKGHQLFGIGDFDHQHIYLLHGEVALTDSRGEVVHSGAHSLFPLAHQQPRAHNATAVTDCSLLGIDSDRLDQLLAWSQIAEHLLLDFSYQRDRDEDAIWIDTVLRSNLFFKVPPINVEAIISRFSPQLVSSGDVVVRQGELGDRCYFIKEGRAEVVRAEDGERTPSHVADIGEGRCFGEDALVNETVRNATVIMRSDGVLMTLGKSDFVRLLKAPEVASVSISRWLQESSEEVVVDVRTEEEYSRGHLAQAVNVPLGLLRIKLRQLDKNRSYRVYCDTGRRSSAVAHILRKQGYQISVLAHGLQGMSPAQRATLAGDTLDYVLRDGVAVEGQ